MNAQSWGSSVGTVTRPRVVWWRNQHSVPSK